MSLQSISFDNIIKTLRTNIITLTGLDGKRVLNSDSVRGTDLKKLVDSTDTMSLDLSDVFILFEIVENPGSELNFTSICDNGKVEIVTSYTMEIHMYGNASHQLSKILLGRLKSPQNIQSLRDVGLFFQEASFPENKKEFMNNTLWQRCDISIGFVTRYETSTGKDGTDIVEYFNQHLTNSDVHLDEQLL